MVSHFQVRFINSSYSMLIILEVTNYFCDTVNQVFKIYEVIFFVFTFLEIEKKNI